MRGMIRYTGLLIVAAFVLSPVPVRAQAPPAGRVPAEQTPSAGRRPLKTYTLSPERYEKAVAFARARYRLYFIDAAWGFAILLVVLYGRLGARLRDGAERMSGRRFVQVALFVPPLLLLLWIFALPTSLYGHWLVRHFDLSVQGWGSWIWDEIKGQLLGFIVGIFLAAILYEMIRRSPKRWWLHFWLISIPIAVLFIFIVPIVVDPLFFKFEPLGAKHADLVAAIEQVVHRAGMDIPPERMFEMKASEKLNALNAYVTGFGASKRVVVWDTTMAKMTADQTLFVFGHEMGHYVLHHIEKTLLFVAAMLFVFFYLGYRGLHWALGRWGGRWGIRGPDDLASLPAMLLILAVLVFISAPLTNTYSRFQEHQADVYGLEVTHELIPDSREVATESFQILGEVDLADPHPSEFIKIWFYTHPPINERIKFAQTYDPWSKGEPAQFIH